MTARSLLLGGDLLVSVLGGVYTDVEKTMIELQRSAIVQETRSAVQSALQNKFIAAVERLSGREVLVFSAHQHVGPDMEVKLFMLKPTCDCPNEEHRLDKYDDKRQRRVTMRTAALGVPCRRDDPAPAPQSEPCEPTPLASWRGLRRWWHSGNGSRILATGPATTDSTPITAPVGSIRNSLTAGIG